MRLDLRQDASRHTEALSAITRQLGLGDYATWTEDERQRVPACRSWRAAGRSIPADLPASPEVREVLDTFRAAATIAHGSLGAYVISMALAPSDVLAVELLQKEAHLAVAAARRPAVRDDGGAGRGGDDASAACWRCRGIARGATAGRK